MYGEDFMTYLSLEEACVLVGFGKEVNLRILVSEVKLDSLLCVAVIVEVEVLVSYKTAVYILDVCVVLVDRTP